jgi:hypothetical protein
VFQDIEVGAKTLKDNILSITDYGKEK